MGLTVLGLATHTERRGFINNFIIFFTLKLLVTGSLLSPGNVILTSKRTACEFACGLSGTGNANNFVCNEFQTFSHEDKAPS